MLAVYHEASTVCDIVRTANAGELVTYSDDSRAEAHAAEIARAIVRLGNPPGSYDPARVRWDHFDEYSARNMTRHLAAIFDRVAGDDRTPSDRVSAPMGTSAHA